MALESTLDINSAPVRRCDDIASWLKLCQSLISHASPLHHLPMSRHVCFFLSCEYQLLCSVYCRPKRLTLRSIDLPQTVTAGTATAWQHQRTATLDAYVNHAFQRRATIVLCNWTTWQRMTSHWLTQVSPGLMTTCEITWYIVTVDTSCSRMEQLHKIVHACEHTLM